MISFISRFKIYFLLAGVILPLEFAIGAFLPPGKYNTNFFEMAYMKNESFQKKLIYEKNRYLVRYNAEFFSVGDSSGLHGIQPLAVMNYLDGAGFVNVNATADGGYDGFRYLAEYYLKRVPKAKHFVFYVSPKNIPARANPLIGPNPQLFKMIRHEYLSIWGKLKPPSLPLRSPITNLAYYGKYQDKLYNFSDTDITGKLPLNEVQMMVQNRGWYPYGVETGLQTEDCDFRMNYKNDLTFEKELDKFATVARAHQANLAIVFSPVSCEPLSGVYTDPVQKQLDSFRLRHPEVFVPFDLMTTWPAALFADDYHLHDEAAAALSERLGKAMKDWLGQEGVLIKSASQYDMRNAFMKDGKLNGTFRSFYESGKLLGERHYENGRLNAKLRLYHEDGKVWIERMYRRGLVEGPAKKFYPNGQLAEQVEIKNGNEIVSSVRYYETGKIKQTTEYKHHRTHGTQKIYYENGQVEYIFPYRWGRLNGIGYEYHENGTLRMVGKYENGRLQPDSKEYYPNGKIKEERFWSNKFLVTTTVRGYYETGGLFQEIHYRYGHPDGISKTFHQNGKLAYEEKYVRGKKLYRQYYDEAGRPTAREA